MIIDYFNQQCWVPKHCIKEKKTLNIACPTTFTFQAQNNRQTRADAHSHTLLHVEDKAPEWHQLPSWQAVFDEGIICKEEI